MMTNNKEKDQTKKQKELMEINSGSGIKRKEVKSEGFSSFDYAPTEDEKETDPFYQASKTAKLSESVILKIRTLKPYIKMKENDDSNTMNELVDAITNAYIEMRLDESERERFKGAYDYMSAYHQD